MPYGQSGSAIFGFPATATNAEVLRLTGITLLSLALLIMAGPALRRRIPNELLS
jgi:hypothetical protein